MASWASWAFFDVFLKCLSFSATYSAPIRSFIYLRKSSMAFSEMFTASVR